MSEADDDLETFDAGMDDEAIENETMDEPTEEEPLEGDEAKTIKIYYSSLDDDVRSQLMGDMKQALNASEDDDYAEKKINEALSTQPLFTLIAEDLVKQLNIDI